jgi:hypothetical protein
MGLGLIIQRRSHFPLGRGRNGPEWPAGMNRNRWPESIGISGRNASEYAQTVSFPKNLAFSSLMI